MSGRRLTEEEKVNWWRFRGVNVPLTCLVLVLACHACGAGSVYSAKGIGLWRLFPSGQGAAMGGAGIALTDHLSINLRNPAARVPAGFTRVVTDASFDFRTTTTSHGSARAHFAQASGFSMLVPVSSRISVSGVLGPVSDVRYAVSTSDSLPGYQYWREVTGQGGLNRGEFALFVKPSRYVYLGVAAQLYFGRIQETWKTTFSSTDFAAANDRFSSHLEGVGGTVGLLVRPDGRWTMGAVLTPATDLEVSTDVRHAFAGADSAVTGTLALPLMWGVGVSYQSPAGLTVAADYYRQHWGSVESSPRARFSYTDVGYAMAGVEYLPSRKLSAPYFKKVAYRAGFRFGHVPVQTASGHAPKEYACTVGCGLPFFSFLGRVDVTYEVVFRGSLAVDPARERVHRVLVSLGGAERWFQRQ